MGLDATNQWPGETSREWGCTITMDSHLQARMDGIFYLRVCEVNRAAAPVVPAQAAINSGVNSCFNVGQTESAFGRVRASPGLLLLLIAIEPRANA